MKSWSKRYSNQGGSSLSVLCVTLPHILLNLPKSGFHGSCTICDVISFLTRNFLLILIHSDIFLVHFVGILDKIGRAVVHAFWQDVVEPKLSIDRYSPHPKKFSQVTMIFCPCSYHIRDLILQSWYQYSRHCLSSYRLTPELLTSPRVWNSRVQLNFNQ